MFVVFLFLVFGEFFSFPIVYIKKINFHKSSRLVIFNILGENFKNISTMLPRIFGVHKKGKVLISIFLKKAMKIFRKSLHEKTILISDEIQEYNDTSPI